MLAKAFRLFVSSTFGDFKLERNVLQEQVFPSLDAYCAAKGYQFYPIDLRWGVSEEAQLDQRTTEICLGEVEAASGHPPPNFLIMLGNRYGWVPLPFAIAQDEFRAITSWLEANGRPNAAAALEDVYERDDNHLVPFGLLGPRVDGGKLTGAFTLRSREDVPKLRPTDAWQEFSSKLSRVLKIAAHGLLADGRIEQAVHKKYLISLTEQEIVQALNRHKGDKHGASQESEAQKWQAATGFIREITNGSAYANPRYIEEHPRLGPLKKEIADHLPKDNLVTANVTLNRSGELDGTYLPYFAAEIEKKLKAAIVRHLAHIEAMERAPDFALTREREAHRTFAKARLKIFIGRENNLEAIAKYLGGFTGSPLVIHGRSGLGKSALMVRAAEAAKATEGTPVVARFIGASPASSDLRSLLTSVVEDLASLGIVSMPAEFEQDANKFNGQIARLLSSIKSPAIIFLDAIDQLQRPYTLGWLPHEMPKALKLVLSVLDDPVYKDDSSFYRSLKDRLPEHAFVEIERLSAANGSKILSELTAQSGRGLQERQRAYIAGKFEEAEASPLYLKTAFEIAKGWKSGSSAGEGRHVLASGTSGIIAQFIEELTSIKHHKRALVTRALGYLAAARNGLSEKELIEVLSCDDDVMSAISSEQFGVHTQKLPPSVWVRLNRALAPLLVEKQADGQPLLNFFHRQVAQVTREQHYEAVKVDLHSHLATYFENQAMLQGERAIYGKRSLSELPHQLHHARQTRPLGRILESPDWIEQKFKAFGMQLLIRDYELFGREGLQSEIGQTLRLISTICMRDKRQLLPQLHGRLLSHKTAGTFCGEALWVINRPALVSAEGFPPPGAEVMRLEGHAERVEALAALPDGRLASCAGDHTIRFWDVATGAETGRLQAHSRFLTALVALPDGRLASGTGDDDILLWDLKTGAVTRRLAGHKDTITALAMLPDGRLASASQDSTIRLWDLKRGIETDRLVQGTNHLRPPLYARRDSELGYTNQEASALAVFPDGRLASGSYDSKVRIWDVKSRSVTHLLEGHTGWVTALAVLPDGRLASAGNDIRLWDPATGTETARLNPGGALTVLSDGRLASGSANGTIRLWDVKTGSETASFKADGVESLTLLLDGRLASAYKDIRLWDINRRAGITGARGHTSFVRCLAALPNGRLASASNSIRVWDVQTRTEITKIPDRSTAVRALAVLPDGSLASVYSRDSIIRIWDAKTGVETAQLKGYSDDVKDMSDIQNYEVVQDLAVLADGRLVAACRYKIQLWENKKDLPDGHLAGPKTLKTPSELKSITVLPNGWLALGDILTKIWLWNPKSGSVKGQLKGHEVRSRANYLALTALPDRRLASGAEDSIIRLWDLRRHTEAGQLIGHTGAVTALAVLQNGLLASASTDNTIRVWEPKSGTCIAGLAVDAGVYSLCALPDGRLVAGDAVGTLHWLEFLGGTASQDGPQKIKMSFLSHATNWRPSWFSTPQVFPYKRR